MQMDWAKTQVVIGFAYRAQVELTHDQAVLQQALSAFQAAAAGYRMIGQDNDAKEVDDEVAQISELLNDAAG